MKAIKKQSLGFLIVFLILAVGTVGALTYMSLYYPQTATVPAQPMIKVYFEGQLCPDGEVFEWGNVSLGENIWTGYVLNVGNIAVNLEFTTEGLPASWTETLEWGTTPINMGENRTVTLILTVPMETLPGDYAWDSTLTAVGDP